MVWWRYLWYNIIYGLATEHCRSLAGEVILHFSPSCVGAPSEKGSGRAAGRLSRLFDFSRSCDYLFRSIFNFFLGQIVNFLSL